MGGSRFLTALGGLAGSWSDRWCVGRRPAAPLGDVPCSVRWPCCDCDGGGVMFNPRCSWVIALLAKEKF
ncbi:hypothetical protein JB92DRAFT_2983830 [Gautieria morchelliformis]|nr:hypothetical protein JB92DRAFT_2983830 [Gautieria morchelliformis]